MQEVRAAAVVSKCPTMLAVYEQEVTTPYLIRPDNGEEYPNPEIDMHLVA